MLKEVRRVETPALSKSKTGLASFLFWPQAGLVPLMMVRSLCVGMAEMV